MLSFWKIIVSTPRPPLPGQKVSVSHEGSWHAYSFVGQVNVANFDYDLENKEMPLTLRKDGHFF